MGSGELKSLIFSAIWPGIVVPQKLSVRSIVSPGWPTACKPCWLGVVLEASRLKSLPVMAIGRAAVDREDARNDVTVEASFEPEFKVGSSEANLVPVATRCPPERTVIPEPVPLARWGGSEGRSGGGERTRDGDAVADAVVVIERHRGARRRSSLLRRPRRWFRCC